MRRISRRTGVGNRKGQRVLAGVGIGRAQLHAWASVTACEEPAAVDARLRPVHQRLWLEVRTVTGRATATAAGDRTVFALTGLALARLIRGRDHATHVTAGPAVRVRGWIRASSAAAYEARCATDLTTCVVFDACAGGVGRALDAGGAEAWRDAGNASIARAIGLSGAGDRARRGASPRAVAGSGRDLRKLVSRACSSRADLLCARVGAGIGRSAAEARASGVGGRAGRMSGPGISGDTRAAARRVAGQTRGRAGRIAADAIRAHGARTLGTRRARVAECTAHTRAVAADRRVPAATSAAARDGNARTVAELRRAAAGGLSARAW